MNQVVISGNVGSVKELKFLNTGTAVLEFSVADKDYKGETVWHNITVMGKSAENVANHIGDVSKVLVKGKLQYNKWEKDGVKHERAYILADNYGGVEFMSYKNKKDNSKEPQREGFQPLDDDDIPF